MTKCCEVELTLYFTIRNSLFDIRHSKEKAPEQHRGLVNYSTRWPALTRTSSSSSTLRIASAFTTKVNRRSAAALPGRLRTAAVMSAMLCGVTLAAREHVVNTARCCPALCEVFQCVLLS